MSFTNVFEVNKERSSDFAYGMVSAKGDLGKTTRIMPNKTNQTRRFQENYKQAAAEFVEKTGQTIEESAAELGVDPAVLRDWTEKLGTQAKPSKPLSTMAQ